MEFLIRTVEIGDNAATASMIRRIFEEHGAPREGTVYSDPNTDRLYELFQEEERSVFYVALRGEEVVGSCGVFPSPGLPEGCVELVKFYVSADARGVGLGRALMEKSTAAAVEMGYRQLYLESLPVFGKAVRIYEKQGFEALDAPLSAEHPGCSLWFLKNL